MFVGQIGHLAHLNARDTSFVLVSRAPIVMIEAFRRRMGWSIPGMHCSAATSIQTSGAATRSRSQASIRTARCSA